MPRDAARTSSSAPRYDARTAHGASEARVLAAVESALMRVREPIVLAVSGGLDSMVLLDAVWRVAPDRIAAVATFDHRSGPHAAAAVAVVRAEAIRRGLRVIVGRAREASHTEADWRRARWAFLNQAARRTAGRVATAHTADDQVETICMRILRGSGARGLAGLRAESGIVRPLLGIRRWEIGEYAGSAGVSYLEDPTNSSTVHLRNRVRRDLLPAIAGVQPGFAAEITALGERAAEIRRGLDAVARGLAESRRSGEVEVLLARVEGLSSEGIRALAPSLSALAGVVLDRRGTTRLSQFILRSRTGARMPLSGGAEAVRLHDRITIRRERSRVAPVTPVTLTDGLVVGQWVFRRVERIGDAVSEAALPANATLVVRAWRDGDRMRAAGSPAARRVKRFFGDAGIAGPERKGWPVVLADGEIVWIPGVRRSDAATDRSGRPVLRYRCERYDV